MVGKLIGGGAAYAGAWKCLHHWQSPWTFLTTCLSLGIQYQLRTLAIVNPTPLCSICWCASSVSYSSGSISPKTLSGSLFLQWSVAPQCMWGTLWLQRDRELFANLLIHTQTRLAFLNWNLSSTPSISFLSSTATASTFFTSLASTWLSSVVTLLVPWSSTKLLNCPANSVCCLWEAHPLHFWLWPHDSRPRDQRFVPAAGWSVLSLFGHSWLGCNYTLIGYGCLMDNSINTGCYSIRTCLQMNVAQCAVYLPGVPPVTSVLHINNRWAMAAAPSKAHAEVSYTTATFISSAVPCTTGLCAMKNSWMYTHAGLFCSLDNACFPLIFNNLLVLACHFRCTFCFQFGVFTGSKYLRCAVRGDTLCPDHSLQLLTGAVSNTVWNYW